MTGLAYAHPSIPRKYIIDWGCSQSEEPNPDYMYNLISYQHWLVDSECSGIWTASGRRNILPGPAFQYRDSFPSIPIFGESGQVDNEQHELACLPAMALLDNAMSRLYLTVCRFIPSH